MNATVQAERTRHQQEAAQKRSSIEAEHDQAQKAAAEARERVAGLAGKIEPIHAHNMIMLARLTPVATLPSKTTWKKETIEQAAKLLQLHWGCVTHPLQLHFRPVANLLQNCSDSSEDMLQIHCKSIAK